jgi:hypothetical protein
MIAGWMAPLASVGEASCDKRVTGDDVDVSVSWVSFDGGQKIADRHFFALNHLREMCAGKNECLRDANLWIVGMGRLKDEF